MKLACLFSGGKDSSIALFRAMNKEEVVCLISMVSSNKESYMFHTPAIELARLQAEAIGLPLILKETRGEKEKELDDLRDAITLARDKYGIEGVVTGAIGSIYQGVRVQDICVDLGLWCFNPLWQKDQKELLFELVDEGFEVIISGVFAYPFDEKWVGRKIDRKTIDELILLNDKYDINPAGEGGEIETSVLDAPYFLKRVEIVKSRVLMDGENSGVLVVEEARVTRK